MSDPWRPEGYANPAFRIQRQEFGFENGGDYVRGSSVTTLPQTALRYPTTVPNYEDVKGKAFLSTRAFDYETAEVGWGWPVGLEETWLEVALVRSGFGQPVTVNDGQTVFRARKEDFQSEGTIDTPPPLVYDTPLQSGHWYYYSLFFKTGPLDWVIGMSGQVLIPRDFKHAEHMWNMIPPYYQYVDGNQREGVGSLRRMLAVFGFEMDTTREYVESVQNLYVTDKAPMSLLRKLGENLGVPYTSAMGQVRYRGLLAGLPDMLANRGITSALQQVVAASSQFLCTITQGENRLLLPDDSDFFTGTGSWGRVLPATDTADADFSHAAADYTLVTTTAVLDPGYGRATLAINTSDASETANLWLSCGGSTHLGVTNEPRYTGVPVDPGGLYGFSFRLRTEQASAIITPVISWYDKDNGYIDTSSQAIAAPGDTLFHDYRVQGIAPPLGIYGCPGVVITGRTAKSGTGSYTQWLTGGMFYSLGDAGAVSLVPPDSFLTLGDAGELLGGGNVLGTP